jgi:hypothetical protein
MQTTTTKRACELSKGDEIKIAFGDDQTFIFTSLTEEPHQHANGSWTVTLKLGGIKMPMSDTAQIAVD